MSETAVLAVLSRLESGQGRIELRLEQLGAGQAKLEARLAAVEAGQGKLEARLAAVEAGQAKLEARLAAVESSQTSLRIDIMGRMDRLENSLTDIRSDIVVNISAVNHIRTMHDNTREEVRLIGDHVARMFMQIKGIQTRLREINGEP